MISLRRALKICSLSLRHHQSQLIRRIVPQAILLVMKKLFVISPFYAINASRADVKRNNRGLK